MKHIILFLTLFALNSPAIADDRCSVVRAPCKCSHGDSVQQGTCAVIIGERKPEMFCQCY